MKTTTLLKKITLLVLCVLSLFGTSAFATTYLVQLGTGGAATWNVSISGTVVNLATVNAGNPASLNEWFTDKILATPSFSGTTLAGGDQIWIINGTYYLTGSMGIKAGVKMYGGFAGTAGETVATRAKNSSTAWDFTNATVLDGSVGGVKTYIGLSGGSTDTRTLVDGITIQNCHNAGTSGSGGGAKVTSSGTTIQNCIITACTSATGASGASAGITIQTGATLKDSYIHHNTNVSAGGGVGITGSPCTVSGCKIDNNTGSEGGGIYLYSTISGLNITNCIISNNTGNGASNGGGGIGGYVAITNASPVTVDGCTFTSNTATQSGGAIYFGNFGSATTNVYNIKNSTFTSNLSNGASASTKGGGAIYLGVSSYSIDKCTFTGNQSTVSGAGAILLNSTSGTTISNCKFTENSCASWGGSAIFSNSNYTANNCLIAKNTGGTPVFFNSSATASTFQNCTFASNLSSSGTEAAIGLKDLTPKYAFTNCLFYKSSTFTGQIPTISYCGFDVAVPVGGTNSITGISSAAFVDDLNGDYSLVSGSAAIDAGTDLSLATSPVTTDITGALRPQGSAFDMGAYEASVATAIPTAVNNPSALYSVSKSTLVSNVKGSLQVINLNGQLVKSVLVDNGTVVALPSGIYVVKFVTSSGVNVQKVSL